MTALILMLTFAFGGVCAFVAYWHGVAAEAQRAKDDRRELYTLRERYTLMQELNADLAHQVSQLRMRERFIEVIEDGWR
jgi:hypothetical protein